MGWSDYILLGSSLDNRLDCRGAHAVMLRESDIAARAGGVQATDFPHLVGGQSSAVVAFTGRHTAGMLFWSSTDGKAWLGPLLEAA
jgi:hypothetical protein